MRVPCVFPRIAGLVPIAYGGIHMEAIGASGGWLATMPELARFVTALDGSRPPQLLRPDSVAAMLRPAHPGPAGKWAHALGWGVTQESGGLGWLKMGSTGGDCTYLRRRPDGLVLAATFNGPCVRGFDEEATQAVAQVKTWPGQDLFSKFGL